MVAITRWNALGIVLFNFYFVMSILSEEEVFKPLINQDYFDRITTGTLQTNRLYVDKTKFALHLLKDGQIRYFFSRPRRMGKTVFLKTLEAIFQGRKNIFQGTTIHADITYDWKEYPIMYFDLSSSSADTVFSTTLHLFMEKYGIGDNRATPIPKKCASLKSNNTEPVPPVLQLFVEVLCVMKECLGRNTVILVDEYDYHLLVNSGNPVNFEAQTKFLKHFFILVKAFAKRIHIAFVTGITRCSFAVIGSEGGDFKDITFSQKYGELAGITENELQTYFNPHVEDVARRRNLNKSEIQNELKEWYNGYSFTGMESLYNPMSIVSYFETGIPDVYWAVLGRATFFWNQMKLRPNDFNNMVAPITCSSIRSTTGDVNHVNAAILMFEAGYLTIEKMNVNSGLGCVLRFSNREAKQAFCKDLVDAKSLAKDSTCIVPQLQAMETSIKMPIPDFDAFTRATNAAFEQLSYTFKDEISFHALFHSFMDRCHLVALEIKKRTAHAEIDIFAETTSTTLIFELKLANEGIKRCWDQVSARVPQFFQAQKNILAAGILFNPSHKRGLSISIWKAELYDEAGTFLKEYSSKDSKWLKEWDSTKVTNAQSKTIKTISSQHADSSNTAA